MRGMENVKFVWDVGTCLLSYMTSYPRRL